MDKPKELGDLNLKQLQLAIVNLEEPADFGSIHRYDTKLKAITRLAAGINERKYNMANVMAAGTADPTKPYDGAKARKSSAEPRKKSGPKPTLDVERAASEVKRVRIGSEAKITVVATENPKRAKSDAFDKFALYKNGMTVEAYIKAGGTMAHVAWDHKKGFVKLS